jgi:hypothetical protein
MKLDRAIDPKPAAEAATPDADLIRALLEAGWTHTETSAHPAHALRPADACGLTLWLTAEAGGTLLQLDAERRRMPDDTIRPPWRAEVYGALLPVTVLTAVAAANAAECRPGSLPGELLAPSGWVRSPNWHREWATPDEDREVLYLDDDPDSADLPWCVQRYDLQTSISIAHDAPATVIAAFALTDAP